MKIATYCFTKEECELLVKASHHRCDRNSNLQYHSSHKAYNIYIKSSSVPIVRNLISSYIIPSMVYKIK